MHFSCQHSSPHIWTSELVPKIFLSGWEPECLPCCLALQSTKQLSYVKADIHIFPDVFFSRYRLPLSQQSLQDILWHKLFVAIPKRKPAWLQFNFRVWTKILMNNCHHCFCAALGPIQVLSLQENGSQIWLKVLLNIILWMGSDWRKYPSPKWLFVHGKNKRNRIKRKN